MSTNAVVYDIVTNPAVIDLVNYFTFFGFFNFKLHIHISYEVSLGQLFRNQVHMQMIKLSIFLVRHLCLQQQQQYNRNQLCVRFAHAQNLHENEEKSIVRNYCYYQSFVLINKEFMVDCQLFAIYLLRVAVTVPFHCYI